MVAWGRKGYFLISGVGNGIANGEVHSGLWLGVSVLYNNTCIVKRRWFFFLELSVFVGEIMDHCTCCQQEPPA